MYNNTRIICIIPARGGSLGLPGKNSMTIAGKPMIVHSIEKALANRMIDRVVISTDDEGIALVAREAGGDVPFLRTPALALSTTPMVPVVIDTLQRLAAAGDSYDVAVMLQANSPLLAPEDIDRVLLELIDKDLDVVFTVTEASHPPQWSISIGCQGPVFAFMPDDYAAGERRQDLETFYRSTGAVYAVRIPYLLSCPDTARLCLPSPQQRSGAVITDPLTAVDIDTELDFIVAEAIFSRIERGIQ